MKKNHLVYLFKTFAMAGLIVAFISGCSKEADEIGTFPGDEGSQAAAVAVTPDGYKIVPNEMLVKFKPGTSSQARGVALGKVNGSVKEKILTNAMKHFGDNEGVTVIKTPMAVHDAVGRMKNLPEVEYAEPNFIYTTDATSNDTYYTNGSLWGMYGDDTSPANEYGSQAGEAWAAGNTGSDKVWIGIIDEGYMYTHEDLALNAGTNPGEIAGNGIDDDGNGYTDDVYGWDFDGNNNTVFDGTADDHGTHVAGTIGAVGGNGKGVAGVCWNVTLMDAKFLGKRGGTTTNAIKAVDYFTNLKTRFEDADNNGIDDNPSNNDDIVNIVATNNSWGGGGFSQGLLDAIVRANKADILFIAAAGNESNDNDATPSYPSSYDAPNVIAVASITSTGGLSSFSNYGATKVHLGAPGSGIYSCVPKKSGRTVISGYASYSGTSMATPHVTGAAALYAASHPGTTAGQIKEAILNATVSTSTLSEKCVTGGRLNVSGF